MIDEPIYLKCTFDCYVKLTENTMKKRFQGNIILLSQIVGTILANALTSLEDISKSELLLKSGEITTKYISARYGLKLFDSKEK